MKLGLVERVVRTDTTAAESMVAEAKVEANDALENLRDLARGIYPPCSQIRPRRRPAIAGAQGRGPRGGRTGRDRPLPRRDGGCRVLLVPGGAAERREVRRGVLRDRAAVPVERVPDVRGRRRRPGFDPGAAERGSGLQGMADRLAALGGTLTVRSAPGEGTTIAGVLPVEAVK